jgi:2-amino-4-ketopentanoate thiolase beta subunit
MIGTGSSEYAAVMARRGEIMLRSLGLDYSSFEFGGGIAFDYEALASSPPYDLAEVRQSQLDAKVGGTPLWELPRLSRLVRESAPPGQGARILLKDEAGNASGSFKARRACLAVAHAAEFGHEGVIAATSGNYGAAVASQAAMRGLKAIVLQEAFDSSWRGQPEILEKSRACEAYGAEVWQLTVGPELFYWQLLLLEQTGFFNASLYTPHGVLGIETIGIEIAEQCRVQFGRDPDAVVVTHSGGGNVTGTARGLSRAGTGSHQVIGVSVDLRGLHMASDHDFNRKSFTTGHSGFAMPFLVNPDRVDVPRNAARGLRYLDRFVTVTQGEVFFATELLARLEGLERGPAGNTSLAAALSIARELPEEALVVVQESEYTGAGKHPTAQLTMARELGIEVTTGDPRGDQPGQRIVIPTDIDRVQAQDVELAPLRQSYLRRVAANRPEHRLTQEELEFLAEDTRATVDEVGEGWERAVHHTQAPAGTEP